jgi:hypothetical protein
MSQRRIMRRTWIRILVPLLGMAVATIGCTASASRAPSSSPTPIVSLSPAATPSPAAISTPGPTPAPSPATPRTGPYLGQTPPGTTPEIFAPGVVSDPGFSEYSGTFSPDGTEYYFYRFSDDAPARILSSRVVDGTWTDPEPLAIAEGFAAAEPHLTLDNQRLYFMWEGPLPYGQPSYVGGGGYFVAERTPGGWSDPVYAGQGMFLSSTRDGHLYTTDMSSRSIDGTTYLARVVADRGLFTGYDRLDVQPGLGTQAHPGISPDGRYLLFDVDSGNHMFVSFRNADGTWGRAIDLQTHGFDPMAGGATVSPDGRYLFFGLRGDIWWVDSRVIEALAPTS